MHQIYLLTLGKRKNLILTSMFGKKKKKRRQENAHYLLWKQEEKKRGLRIRAIVGAKAGPILRGGAGRVCFVFVFLNELLI